MVKIYTRGGDQGKTSLFNGKRVHKYYPLIDLLGLLDELNSHIGLLISVNKDKKINSFLYQVQSTIFEIGSEVANPNNHNKTNFTKYSTHLEKEIDEMDKLIPPIKNFILPGGSILSSHTHIARSVARRVEREFVRNLKNFKNPTILIYLNRLSDYLFTLGRYANYKSKTKDIFWKKNS